jgi:toxin CcdB
MAQYSIYHNNNPISKKIYPFLIDVQSMLLNTLETRLVIPVIAKKNYESAIIKNLNPLIKIEKKEYVVLTQQMAAVKNQAVGSLVCDCLSKRQEILAAIDFLITGI